MTKALGIAGRTLLITLALSLASAGCSDLDKAIEDKANEVLGKKPEGPVAPEQPATTPPTEPAPTPAPTEVPPEAPVEPAPVPTPPPAKPVVEKPEAPEPVKPTTTTKPAPTKPVEVAKPVEPAPVKPKPVEVKPAPTKPAEVATKPVEPEPKPKPATKVSIPQSKHLKVSVPSRVQELLNADPRMQPWLNSTLAVIEKCYEGVLASNPSAAGTIKFVLEMHENARPDADITALPPELSGVVACGTGKLMRAKRMPLFTGQEGEKHTVSVKFVP